MRVLITGAGGLLGREVDQQLESAGHEVLKVGHEFDISDPMSAAKIASSGFGRLDWLINCAAYTAVDKAETEAQLAYEVNGLGPAYLGRACSTANVKLIHLSTDFVFDGEKREPYVEDDLTHPLNSYGRSKLAGEEALAGNHLAVVLRTSWLFGPQGKCFPASIIAAHERGKKLRVVADQFGTPTYTPHLAKRLVQIVERNPFPGIYHLAGPEQMSWHTFATRLLTAFTHEPIQVEAIKTTDWPTPALRPPFSALDSSKMARAGIEPLPHLQDALVDFCRNFQSRKKA